MATIQTLDTQLLTPTKRLGEWNDCISSSFASCVVDAKRDFIAKHHSLKLASCHLARVQGDAAKIQILGNANNAKEQQRFAVMSHPKGIAQYHINNMTFNAGSDEFVFIDMNTKFSVDIRSDNKDVHKLIIPALQLSGVTQDLASLNGVRFSKNAGAGTLLNSLWSNIWENHSTLPDNCDQLLIDATHLLLSTVGVNQQDIQHTHLPRIINFIERHFANEKLTTSVIADKLGMSERSVQMAFASMNTTPSAYIRQYRLKKAATLLRIDQSKISQIAYSIGFSDISLFNRQFKHQFHCSPSDYRKKLR